MLWSGTRPGPVFLEQWPSLGPAVFAVCCTVCPSNLTASVLLTGAAVKPSASPGRLHRDSWPVLGVSMRLRRVHRCAGSTSFSLHRRHLANGRRMRKGLTMWRRQRRQASGTRRLRQARDAWLASWRRGSTKWHEHLISLDRQLEPGPLHEPRARQLWRVRKGTMGIMAFPERKSTIETNSMEILT